MSDADPLPESARNSSLDLAEAKAQLRRDAFARRKAAHGAADAAVPAACARLVDAFAAIRAAGGARVIAGYWPIRTEIDPRPAMEALHAAGATLCLPVVEAAGRPLVFRPWSPGCAMEEGAFGAAIPADPAPMIPDALIVPLVGFDRLGARLGYGGGFYDRTLEGLRRAGPIPAIGFAYAAQECAAPLPVEPTDQPLTAIVTEIEALTFG